MTDAQPLLAIDRLAVRYGAVEAVRGANLTVRAGELVALVGGSGSGKSTLTLAAMGLVEAPGQVTDGAIALAGEDVRGLDERALRRLRGVAVGYVPQDPLAALDPVRRIGVQVAEPLAIHRLARGAAARERVHRALADAGLRDPEGVARRYPHQLSGGMRQRALIAAAIVAGPRLLIADEPTSALDVTVQRRILDQLDALRDRLGLGILLVTHDLALAAERADRVVVMRAGETVEDGPAEGVLRRPRHSYTRELLAAMPSAVPPPAPSGDLPPLLTIDGLVKTFAVRRGLRSRDVRALDGVSLTVGRGETLGLVGESGSGKTTLARIVLRLLEPSAGRVAFDGEDLLALHGPALRRARRRLQPVFQDPRASLDPRFSVEEIVAEPLRAAGVADRRALVVEQLERVLLPSTVLTRRPAELSGGERQRVALARALVLRPALLICDEIVSALDVAVQAQILDLLVALRDELDLSLLFISHDLGVVRAVADRVCVLRGGAVVEQGPTATVLTDPVDPYTKELVAAAPGPNPITKEHEAWTSAPSPSARR